MKQVFLLVSVVVFLTLTSCHKCSECHYESENSSGQEVEIELGEFCDEDLENLELNGYQLNDSTIVEVHCHEH